MLRAKEGGSGVACRLMKKNANFVSKYSYSENNHTIQWTFHGKKTFLIPKSRRFTFGVYGAVYVRILFGGKSF